MTTPLTPTGTLCWPTCPARGWTWWCAPAVTWSPENLEGVTLDQLDQIRALCAHKKCVAVGEVGLDYYWVKTPEDRADSRDFFDAQLSLAEELDLPVIVHDRDAHKDCMDIVKAHPKARGVFHCCALGPEDAKRAVDWGWMLSFTGNITFKNARRAPEVISWMPMDRLMLETDAPYMAPEPYRGRRCDSSLIPLMAQTVAQLKGLTTGHHAGERKALFWNRIRTARRPPIDMEVMSYDDHFLRV